MADENKNLGGNEDLGNGGTSKGADEGNKQPSIAELQAQLQELMTDNAKLKRSVDKASSEAADYKKKYKASLNEAETASLEKAEKEAEREEQFKTLLRENQINKLEKSYLSIGYTAEEASQIAIAEIDEDFETKVKIIANVDARKRKEYEAEFLKNRPNVNAGTGVSQITKEQFDKMSIAEKSTLYRENKAEYDRLNSL